jgi:hypothetical protein
LVWQDNQEAGAAIGNPQGTPNLVVDQTTIDFGDVKVNRMVEASFKLSNTGDKAVSLVVPPAPEVIEGC